MKNLLKIVLFVLMCVESYAGSGKATAPMLWVWKQDNNYWYMANVFVTNITDHPINVTITYYNKNGGTYPANFTTCYNMINNNTQIAAKSTARIQCIPPTAYGWDWGPATICWSNVAGDEDDVALRVSAHTVSHTPYADSLLPTPVNQSEPF